MAEQIEVQYFSDEDLAVLRTANSKAFPCNSLPFLRAVESRLNKLGTNSLMDDRAQNDVVIRAALVVLIQQYGGQLIRYDPIDEWGKMQDQVKALGINVK